MGCMDGFASRQGVEHEAERAEWKAFRLPASSSPADGVLPSAFVRLGQALSHLMVSCQACDLGHSSGRLTRPKRPILLLRTKQPPAGLLFLFLFSAKSHHLAAPSGASTFLSAPTTQPASQNG